MNPQTALDSDVRACAKVKVKSANAGKMLAPPRVPWFFQGSLLSRELSPLLCARTRHAMEPNAKKPRHREIITLPDDLAAVIGCREVYEDELEARLRVSEEVRFEDDGRLLQTMLSLGLEEFRNALSSIDVHMLSLVNRACREGVREWTGGWPTRLLVRDFVVSKEKLKWARANGCPWNKDTCKAAARGGHLEVLQWARTNGCPWDKDTCKAAAWGGHLEVLGWARANGCPWNVFTCEAVALGGHLEMLQWARANGCPWDKYTCKAAARGGHLEVLGWARANGCPWDEDTCEAAAGGGHLEVLQWARENECPWD